MQTRYLLSLLWLGQFAVAGPRNKHDAAVSVKTPNTFAEQADAHGTTVNSGIERWWATLNDPELNGLIARAVESNLDLKLAGARLLEARAARRIARADLLPSVNSVNSFQRIRGGFVDGNIHVPTNAGGNILVSPFESNIFQIGFDASWEIDLFGGKRHQLEAATAEVQESEETRRDVMVSLLGEVARNYIELRGAQRRLQITESNIAFQQDSLHLTEVRAEAGLGNELDVQRQQEQVETSEALVPAIETEIKMAIHRLGVLLGLEPASLQQELELEGALPANPLAVPIGLPADLLNRRPDLRQARAAIIAAAAQVGAAKADLFPKILLSGAVGRQATDFSGLTLGGGNFFQVGPAITIPIFEAGRIRGNIAAKKQQLEEAKVQYQQAVLNALRETEDALTAYGREQDRRKRLLDAVESSRNATQLATELYSRGLTDFLSVLDAQRDQLANEDALVASDTAVLTDLVALYKSLGGGWDVSDKR